MSNFYAEIHFLISEKTLKSQKADRLKCFWLSLEEFVCPCSFLAHLTPNRSTTAKRREPKLSINNFQHEKNF